MTRGRPKKQVNQLSSKRLGILLDELKKRDGIRQIDFAERIHMAQQNVSRLRNGRVNLSAEHAKSIAAAFPEYRVEWLLGLDDFKTEEEYEAHLEKRSRAAFAQALSEHWSLQASFRQLAELNGYTVIEGFAALSNDDKSGIPGGDSDKTIKDSWYVRRGYEWARFSRKEMTQLQKKIADYVGFELEHAFEEQENRS